MLGRGLAAPRREAVAVATDRAGRRRPRSEALFEGQDVVDVLVGAGKQSLLLE